jgi:hypothetical protein
MVPEMPTDGEFKSLYWALFLDRPGVETSCHVGKAEKRAPALSEGGGDRVRQRLDQLRRAKCLGSAACLGVASPFGIPDNFTLLIEPDQIIRQCHVAWMKDKRIGIQFV